MLGLCGMRLGCGGCLSLLGALAFAAAAVGGAVWALDRLLETPALPVATGTAEDGVRGQRKLLRLVRGGSGAGEVSLTEREINALLARHLAGARHVLLAAPVVRLPGHETVEVTGRLTLGQALEERPLRLLREVLPRAWRERPVWIFLRAHVEIETRPRRHLRLDVERFSVGRLPMPVIAARVLLDPGTLRLLRWPLPDEVRAVTIEPGRAIIRTGP